MKSLMRILFFAVIGVIFLPFYSQGQATGDYRSFSTGNWSNVNTWERYNGSSWINPAPSAPTSTDGVITIQSGHTITDATGATADQMVIESGGILTLSGVTFTVAAGNGDDLTINSGGTVNISSGATLQIQNSVVPPPPKVGLVRVYGTINNAGAISNASASTLFFEAGSNYDHQHTTIAGIIPTASWDLTSTCSVTGYTTNSNVPTGLSQSFGNFTWDTGSLSSYIDLNGGLTTVNGNLTIQNIPSSYVYLTSTTNYTLTVGGNMTISNCYMGFNSTATVTINVTGDVLFSGNSDFNPTFNGNTTLDINGDLEISGGTTNLTYGGSANLLINLAGDFTLSSSPAINNGGSGIYTLTFDGSGAQNYSAAQAFTDYSYVILNGSTVDVANGSYFGGSGDFTLQGGATLGVGSVDGLDNTTTSGNVRVSGTRNYTANANIVYNGSAAQDLGSEWDTGGALNSVAVNLEIDNSNGVTNDLIAATNIVGDLILTSGSFNIGGSNSMDIQSNFIVTSGTMGGSTTSDLTFSGSGTMGTLAMTSGMQELNDLTVSRAGDLVLGSDLTIGGTLDLTGNLDFSHTSARSLTLNGTMTGTGGLKSNNNCTLTIGGTGAFGTINYAGSGNQLASLVLNRTSSGTYTWSSSVTIVTDVTHNFGALTHTSGLTMGTGSTYYRGAGSLSGLAPLATTNYSVEYTVGGNTGLELPTSASALLDLRMNTGGTVTLQNDVTINGDFVLDGGTFDASANDITMAGTGVSISANGGAFSQANTNAVIFSGSVTLGGTSIDGGTIGNIEITGTLNMPDANINVDGYFDNTGTFTANNGTVTFTGASSTITGNTTTFHNLSVSGAGNLTAYNGTTNVSGSFANAGTFNANSGTIVMTTSGTTDVINGTTSFNNLTINATGEVNLSSDLDVNGNLTLTAGTLDVTNSNRTINIAGNWTNNGGTFNERSGSVIFDGTNSTIAGSATTNFYDLEVSNGTVRVNGTATLENTLTLASSTTFDADGTGSGSFTLLSTSSGDARIAAIPGGSSVTGDLTFQRYLPSYGDRRWRNIGSSVANATVADIQSEIPVSGTFTGNDNGTGGIPSGANPSLAYYDESQGLGVDNDWIYYPVTTNTETFSVGRGYSIYVRETGAVTFDLTGTLNQGNISLPASGTGDLWNLVSNPYPSSIDWDNGSGWTRSNIQGDAIAVWNGLQYLTWNGSTGSLGNGRIPMGMAFWVQASNSSISLNINENAKTATTGTVHRIIEPTSLELLVTGVNYVYTDKTHITFNEESTTAFDEHDFGKLSNSIFNLSTLSSDGEELSINSLASLVCGEEIPINITNLWVDSYRMEWEGIENLDPDLEIYILDNSDAAMYNLREDESFILEVTTESDHYDTLGTEENPYYTYQISNRLSLVVKEKEFSSNLDVTASQICEEEIKANVTILGAEEGVLYQVYNDDIIVADGIGNAGDLEIQVSADYLVEGDNNFSIVASRGECNYTEFDNPVVINIIESPEIIHDANTGELSVSVNNGDIQWYADGEVIAGETGNTLTVDDRFGANYTVKVLNGDCEKESEVFAILGVEDQLQNSGIEVYPNPSTNKININLEKSAISDVLLRIVSSSGRVIYQKDHIIGKHEVDVSSFENGIYFIEVIAEADKYVTRIVKQ